MTTLLGSMTKGLVGLFVILDTDWNGLGAPSIAIDSDPRRPVGVTTAIDGVTVSSFRLTTAVVQGSIAAVCVSTGLVSKTEQLVAVSTAMVGLSTPMVIEPMPLAHVSSAFDCDSTRADEPPFAHLRKIDRPDVDFRLPDAESDLGDRVSI